ncbi:MAG: hypothetical protein JO053_16350 [Acidobacteria bacterium]|nr:hypothetical protein [Acidobacteriota bacterium]
MKTRLSALILFSAAFAGYVDAKAWNGIEPLKTTFAEAKKVLGEPVSQDRDGRSIFETKDYYVTLVLISGNCFEDVGIISEKDAMPSSLVGQITLSPKISKSLEEFPDLSDVSKPLPPDSDPKSVYKRWLSNDVDCFGNGEEMSCSVSNSQEGIGYTDSKAGIVHIYYFATLRETSDFKTKHKPCRASGL